MPTILPPPLPSASTPFVRCESPKRPPPPVLAQGGRLGNGGYGGQKHGREASVSRRNAIDGVGKAEETQGSWGRGSLSGWRGVGWSSRPRMGDPGGEAGMDEDGKDGGWGIFRVEEWRASHLQRRAAGAQV